MGWAAELVSSVLLFFLVFGMSATVELKQLRKQINNWTALLIGVCMQFLILPFVGFVVVKLLALPAEVGITLLVVTSSPGGSYSNWWCSLFNAEFSLSVTMTAISTLLSTVMLPTNLILYARWTYSSAVVQSLDWTALFVSLVVVLGGITCGLLASVYASHTDSSSLFHRRANLLGNFAGIGLITLSVSVSSSDHQASLWEHDARFYIGVALPAMIGLAIATFFTTKCHLEKPERVAVAVESCYQNTGIATSVALTMFSGNADKLATAIGVPLLYGIIEAAMLACFCLVCWKIGWTKAPAKENLCVVLYNSYEVEEQDREELEESIEVVLGSPDSKDSAPNDLIFAQTESGNAYVVDTETLDKIAEGDLTEDATDASLNDDDGSDHNDGGGLHSSERTRRTTRRYAPVEPSSPTDSSRSSSEGPVEDTQTMILEMEDEDRLQRLRGGRLGRTISTLRARATGYLQAPVASTLPDDSHEFHVPEVDSRIQSPASEEMDDHNVRGQTILSQDYHVIPAAPETPTPESQRKTIMPVLGKQID